MGLKYDGNIEWAELNSGDPENIHFGGKIPVGDIDHHLKEKIRRLIKEKSDLTFEIQVEQEQDENIILDSIQQKDDKIKLMIWGDEVITQMQYESGRTYQVVQDEQELERLEKKIRKAKQVLRRRKELQKEREEQEEKQ